MEHGSWLHNIKFFFLEQPKLVMKDTLFNNWVWVKERYVLMMITLKNAHAHMHAHLATMKKVDLCTQEWKN